MSSILSYGKLMSYACCIILPSFDNLLHHNHLAHFYQSWFSYSSVITQSFSFVDIFNLLLTSYLYPSVFYIIPFLSNKILFWKFSKFNVLLYRKSTKAWVSSWHITNHSTLGIFSFRYQAMLWVRDGMSGDYQNMCLVTSTRLLLKLLFLCKWPTYLLHYVSLGMGSGGIR